MRVLFFGMRCAFSIPVLTALIDGGIAVDAVVLPVRPPCEPDHHIDHLARAAGIPAISVPHLRDSSAVTALVESLGRRGAGHVLSPGGTSEDQPGTESPGRTADAANLSPERSNRLASFTPDALVVACFPWKLPAAVRSLAPLGGINVHPSLLPALRGPEPVFWALRRGDRRTGVTLHLLDAGFDTGPIVAREHLDIPPGVRAPDLEARLAEMGARLLVPALRDLAAGRATPRAQDDSQATLAPVPAGEDWLIPTNLPAGWAYAFARGVAPLGGPLALLVLGTGERLPIADAISVDPSGRMDVALKREGDSIVVRFRPGTAVFTLKT